nr:hypothetical protein [Streptomyces sp. SID5468]
MAVVCAGLLAAGCAGDPDEGTNGVGRLPAPTIVRQARDAAEHADTVRLTGSVVSRGRTYRLDMRLAPDGGTGQVATDRRTFTLLRVGGDLYLKGGAGFYDHAQPSAAAALTGKYVKVPAGDPAYRELSGFTDKKSLLDGLFALGGHPARGDHRTVAGVRTVAVTADAGTLDVSLEGLPYPVRYQRAGGAGSLRLADWGEPVAVRAPRRGDVVDYGRQISAG